MSKITSKVKNGQPIARRPRGFEDKGGDLLRLERELINRAFGIFDAWGFEPLQTPTLEYADVLGKYLPDDERPNTGVFALRDDDNQWLSLRYDLTAPLARYVAENYNSLSKPYRRYQSGSVYRNEKVGQGRFREFIQCDADTVGASSATADAEMCMLSADVAAGMGLKEGQYIVKVSNRKLLDALCDNIGFPSTDHGKEQHMIVLRAIDKLDRLGLDGVAALLGSGRKDESGAFSKGAGLSVRAIKAVIEFISINTHDRQSALTALSKTIGLSSVGKAGIAELSEIDALLTKTGYGHERVNFDTSVVRGLGYYTGPVFETELLTPIVDDKGDTVKIGSIGGGGRYDDLIARFRGQKLPATGCSFGISRFIKAMTTMKSLEYAVFPPVIICSLDESLMGKYMEIASQLRAQGIRVEVYVGSERLGKQLKYADHRNAKFAVIIGEDEISKGVATVKDLWKGSVLSENIKSHAEWKEQQMSQTIVPLEKLADFIRQT